MCQEEGAALLRHVTEAVNRGVGLRYCLTCDELLPLTRYRRSGTCLDAYGNVCKDCIALATSRIVPKVAEKWCKGCSRTLPAAAFARRADGIDGLQHYCKSCDRELGRRYRAALKATVIAGYGGRCMCPGGCDVTELSHLTIDHIHGGGSAERATGIKTSILYRRIIRQGFPRDLYRVLCWNCNCGRESNDGRCAHEGRREPARGGN